MPIANAVLELTGAGARFDRQLSDSAGRFLFRDVPPGTYRMTASALGFSEGGAGADGSGALDRRLDIRAGDAITTVEILLWPAAAIEGTVTDDRGQPLVGLTIRAIPADASSAASPPTRERSAITNDLGEYSITGLGQGSYIVASSAKPEIADTPPAGVIGPTSVIEPGPSSATVGVSDRSPTVWMRPLTFWGGSPGQVPRAIALSSGQRLGGVDLVVPAVRGVRVEGTTIVPPSGRATVYLYPYPRDRFVPEVEAARFNASPDGRFRFANVAEGSYRLVATAAVRDGNANVPYVGESAVDVIGGDVTDLVVALRPGPILQGTLSVDQTSGDTPMKQGIELALEPSTAPVLGTSRGGARVTAQPDGGFSAGPLLPGFYRLRAISLQEFTIAWAPENGSGTTRCPLAVFGDVKVTVFLTAAAALEGTVARPSRADAPISVLVFPADARDWFEAGCDDVGARRLELDPSGAFTAAGLPAGEYFIVALPADLVTTQWRSARVLEELAARATRVALRPREKQVVRLTSREP